MLSTPVLPASHPSQLPVLSYGKGHFSSAPPSHCVLGESPSRDPFLESWAAEPLPTLGQPGPSLHAEAPGAGLWARWSVAWACMPALLTAPTQPSPELYLL